MLTLPVERRGAVVVLADDAGGPSRVTLARPRLARRDDGTPRLALVRWAAPPEAGGALPPVGGRLSLDLETEPAPADLAAAGLAPADVAAMPWTDATVRLEGPGFAPVEAEASLAGGGRAALATDLSREAAAVLAPLLGGESASPLQVTWAGHVRVRLPAVEVLASADFAEVRRRLEAAGGAASRSVVETVLTASARVEIRGGVDGALEEALRGWVLDELARRLADGGAPVVRASAADVVRWPLRLATTLDELAPAGERGDPVTTMVLGAAEVGAEPPVEVRALADFDGALERVDVQLRPLAGGEAVDLSLTDAEPRRVRPGTPDLRWRRRTAFAGRRADPWSEWSESRGSYGLLVPVAVVERLEVEVVAAGLDFTERWRSVRVELEHRPPGRAAAAGAVELDAERPSASWSAAVDGVRGPVSARLLFVSRLGSVVEGSAEATVGDQVVVRDPLDAHRLRCALVPTGAGWNDVAGAMVDLRYRDGEQVSEETVPLTGLDDFAEWEAPARPAGPREVEWRLHASFADGRFEQTGWNRAEGGVVTLPLAGGGERTVELLPVHFDPAVTPRLEVVLTSGDTTRRVEITDPSPRRVTLPPGPFLWSATWSLAGGGDRPLEERTHDDDVLVLPRLP